VTRRRAAALALAAALGLALRAGAQPAPAESPPAPSAAPAAEAPAWAYDMAHELMSPFCPGRALAECPSPQADELRVWILAQARAGATREEVEAQLLGAFGDKIRQAPRPEGVGLVAYVVPALLVVGGALLLWLFLRRQAGAPPPAPSTVDPVARDPDLERRLDEELRA